MSVEVMKQALELCTEIRRHAEPRLAALAIGLDTALRLAIEQAEQAEQQEGYGVVYEFDTPFGLRKSFDYRPYNGSKPTRAVEVYTAPPQRQPEQEPVAQAWAEGYRAGIDDERMSAANIGVAGFGAKVEPARNNPYRTATPQRQPLTERELELIDGMIGAQLYHAAQCDGIANRVMAEKQKGWDMERVELLRKLKAAHGIGGEV